MPELQELVLKSPSMMNPCFHVTIEGKDHQKWERSIGKGDEIECYLQEKGAWQKGTIDSWYIDDASGNAPGADAHFFLTWKDGTDAWRYDLHRDLLVRLEVPTHEELIAMSKWCEGGDWEGGWYNEPYSWVPCSQEGTQYKAGGGQAVWYCDKHKPNWLS